ncbi:MAG TPA: acyl-CoA dehydrogenase family protein [Candidatus Limnocylindrales bacterium]|nr:acyl-CoA dehydrogenase family protein [Candidatus Limnocylindrales bacterium]
MDTSLAEGLQELLAGELAEVLRRVGERPMGSGQAGASLDPAEAAARKQVWQVLCDLGVPRLPAADLVEVFESMGFAAYSSPLLDTVTAAALISACGSDPLALLPRIAGGAVTVALAGREHGTGGPLELPPLSARQGAVTALRRFVPFAAEVDYLLVAGQGPYFGLVKRDQDGVKTRRHDDITRGDLYAVTFEGACATRLTLELSQYAAALGMARLLHAAYLVGLARGALALTVTYVRQRYAFAQPIGRFQAPAFRLAALRARIEAAYELVRLGSRQPDPTLTAVRALALAGDLARDASSEAVQLHGAYGMTEQCDAQRFYRCAALGAIWLGSPTALRAELASHL